MIDVDALVTHPGNARRGDVPAIMRSLERFGQVKPIVVQSSTGYVVAGNHVLAAAKRLGWKTVKAIVEDMDDETATAYLIADNRTSDRAKYDVGGLNALLANVLDLEGTGFDEGDLEAIQEQLSGAKESARAKPALDAIELEVEEVDDEPNAPEPMRQIPLRLAKSQIEGFGQKIVDLQSTWDLRTLAEVIMRAVDEAHVRWQAQVRVVGQVGSRTALPELVGTDY